MKRTNLNSIKWVEHKSPKGKFHLFYRDTGKAFETKKAGPKLPAEPPFEVELVRVPPGAKNFPFHSHTTEWEYYLIVSGTATMRVGKKRTKIKAGDCLLCPPGEPHQIINTGKRDLLYYIIANNSLTDTWHYPDSNKWGARAIGRKRFRLVEVGYYDGEE
jgi:mannose-6-phosphate isomerase-like protein (cupin superfamily)